MNACATRMVCTACGAEPEPPDEPPFRCPAAREGDGVDHVLGKSIELEGVRFADEAASHPFVRHRELLHAFQSARAEGLEASEWEELVLDLDERVRAVDGTGFRATPFARDARLSEELGFSARGGVWVKDETGNVAGSHKARHLFGVALWLLAFERLGYLPQGGERVLAIASCGNAALAAAVVARALENPLEVFVPVDAHPGIVARLGELGARIHTCPRTPGETGDPCFARYRERVAEGAVPFSVQGPENGLVIEGASTLAYEIAEALAREGAVLSSVFVQVGGGALASACIQGFAEAQALGVVPAPVVRTVQTLASPLAAAYARAEPVLAADGAAAHAELARHRARYMQPLAEAPHSIATGILDDETYDWRALVEHAHAHAAPPLTCSEERLAEAWELARRDRPVCATGAAGLAGLLELRARGGVDADENVAVLFTGVER